MKTLSESFLYLLTPPDLLDPDILSPMIIKAIHAGADIIQFRNKMPVSVRELIAAGSRLCESAHREGAVFIVNDRIDVALATGADGVHLGQEDLPLIWARRILSKGNKMAIGISTHSIDQAAQAESEGADYVGFGPVYPTSAKPEYTPVGTGSFSALNKILSIPYFVIGGICMNNIDQVAESGARRVAVCNGVFGQKDISSAAASIKRRLLQECLMDETR